MNDLAIRPARPDEPDIAALLEHHLAEMHAWSPACKVNALPGARLADPEVTFFAARRDGKLAAIGAIKQLAPDRGELKSMRAAPAFRGTGAGRAMLEHLLAQTQARGWNWVGLETGRTAGFAPAIALYRRYGFAECAAFGNYVTDDFSMCMSRDLAGP